jgi:hypothetical protein
MRAAEARVRRDLVRATPNQLVEVDRARWTLSV